MRRRLMFLVMLTIVVLVVTGTFLLNGCKSKEPSNNITKSVNNEIAGDQSCKTCHSNEYHDWLQSDHFKAMQPANDSTVEGDFNNKTYTADGITSHFFKKNGKFYINTQGEDGMNHDYEVRYTFGFTPLQQYLVEFSRGRMQVPRVSWDIKKKKWFDQYPGQNIPAHDWLHWTGNGQNWNTMCASCHSTNLQKNYDVDADSYHTTYSLINVSCEACHGPGKLHIDYINSDDYKKGNKIAGAYIQLNRGAGQAAQLNTCAICHARKSDLSATLIQSDEIMDNYIPEIPGTEHFHADGQVNDEDYIYTSFLESKMFSRGVKCSNCHNPHTGKMLFNGNQLCMQCHTPSHNDVSHTFHAVGSAGSECKNCHMPGKFYMVNDYRHDHSFRVPRPDLSVKYGTPNACNNCHADKTAQWASDAIVKWYGPSRKYHFAEDLIPGSKMDEASEGHLIHLLNDTAVPKIVKATAAHYLGNISTQNSLHALINSLSNSDAHTKYRALRSLSNFEVSLWRDDVGPLLADKARAVRIAAAELYSTIPVQDIPAQYVQTFYAARGEFQNYLNYQADFSVGKVMLADYYLRQQDYTNAEKFYKRALSQDSMMNYARLNLSTVYNIQGKNDQALKELEAAKKIDPKNDRIYYNLALLYNELNDIPKAENSFAKAVELNTNNPRVYYNYGLLLSKTKKYKEAETVLQKGIVKSPSSPELYYALCIAYIEVKDFGKAREAGSRLKSLDGNNPDYIQLFNNLGIH